MAQLQEKEEGNRKKKGPGCLNCGKRKQKRKDKNNKKREFFFPTPLLRQSAKRCSAAPRRTLVRADPRRWNYAHVKNRFEGCVSSLDARN
jgi:hypothetical protein